MRAFVAARSRNAELLTPYGLAGTGLVAACSFLYLLVTDVSFLREGLPETEIEVLLLVVPAVGLLYTAYWLHSGSFRPAEIWAIGAFAIGGVLIGALTTTLLFFATASDIAARPTFFLFVSAGTEGALLGVLAGAFVVGPLGRRNESAVERLETVNRLLCHNIRNRITIVNAALARLERSADPEGVETIRAQRDAIVDLLEDTEAVVSAATEPGDLSPVDLAVVVERQLRVLEESHGDVSIEAELPESATVLADDLLGAVVENVLQNAVIHNDQPTPEIEVTVVPDGREVRLRVADNGPGIPDDQKERVLDPDAGGGIGLYLVDTLVARYGGEIRVTDNEPRGAAFVVTFRRS